MQGKIVAALVVFLSLIGIRIEGQKGGESLGCYASIDALRADFVSKHPELRRKQTDRDGQTLETEVPHDKPVYIGTSIAITWHGSASSLAIDHELFVFVESCPDYPMRSQYTVGFYQPVNPRRPVLKSTVKH